MIKKRIFFNQYPPMFTCNFVIGQDSIITETMVKYKMFPGYFVEAEIYLYGKYSAKKTEYVHVKVKEPERGLVVNEFDIPSGKFSKLVQTNVCSQNLGTQYIS